MTFDLFDCFYYPVDPFGKDFRFDEERWSSIFTDSVHVSITGLLSCSMKFPDCEFSFDTGAFSVRFRFVEGATFLKIRDPFSEAFITLPLIHLFTWSKRWWYGSLIALDL